MRILLFLFPLCLLIGLSGCKKAFNGKNTTGKLTLSADTLVFDTLFTTYNSPTGRLYVHNRTDGVLNIDFIGIDNPSTEFSLIVDGVKTNQTKNYELPAGDSILIFASYKARQQTITNYLAEETIRFSVNGHTQQSILRCFSVNGIMLYTTLPTPNYTMQDTAYIIRDTLSIPLGQTLTIKNKARLYFDNGAALLVRGTLVIEGTKNNPITFQGVRLDDKYKERAGQWSGIYYYTSSRNNTCSYAEIKNGYYGMYVAYPQDNNIALPKLTLGNTKIHDMQVAGITGAETNIYAYNSLVYDCGESCVQMLSGGTYQYDYCTFYGDASKYSHEQPTFVALDYYGDPRAPTTVGTLNLLMRNTIVEGNGKPEDEFYVGLVSTNPFGYNITNCMLKTKNLAGEAFLNTASYNNILNQNPLFENTSERKFYLKNTSPAKKKAISIIGLDKDLEDNLRNATEPTIGAYE